MPPTATLKQHGYAPHKPPRQRRAILSKLILTKTIKASTAYKYILSLSHLYSPRSSYIHALRGDARWIRKKYYDTRYW